MKGDPVAVIEAAYAVDRPPAQWLDGVLESLSPCLDEGLGVWAALYDVSDPNQFRFERLAQRGLDPQHFMLLETAAPTVDRDNVERTFLSQICGTLSELLGREWLESHPIAQGVRESFRVADALGINAMDPTLRGCVLAVPMTSVRPASKQLKARWSRIAAHVSAGHRLRRQIEARTETLIDGAEAVLEADGKIAHARGEAKEKAARAALRGAAAALDKARTRRVRDARPDDAIEGWKGLVSGRWSLVDHFERDGRRYLVARRNDPELDAGALSLRERQVAGFAALGHSNKLIGYEMGLSPNTVATHLMHAARKLKVRSRAALIQSFRR